MNKPPIELFTNPPTQVDWDKAAEVRREHNQKLRDRARGCVVHGSEGLSVALDGVSVSLTAGGLDESKTLTDRLTSAWLREWEKVYG